MSETKYFENGINYLFDNFVNEKNKDEIREIMNKKLETEKIEEYTDYQKLYRYISSGNLKQTIILLQEYKNFNENIQDWLPFFYEGFKYACELNQEIIALDIYADIKLANDDNTEAEQIAAVNPAILKKIKKR